MRGYTLPAVVPNLPSEATRQRQQERRWCVRRRGRGGYRPSARTSRGPWHPAHTAGLFPRPRQRRRICPSPFAFWPRVPRQKPTKATVVACSKRRNLSKLGCRSGGIEPPRRQSSTNCCETWPVSPNKPNAPQSLSMKTRCASAATPSLRFPRPRSAGSAAATAAAIVKTSIRRHPITSAVTRSRKLLPEDRPEPLGPLVQKLRRRGSTLQRLL
mmetsp:Transcript_81901/g.265334  ORF Transcript_81901/g.265334 Transcript_81901/m.265334 type:complete len:214 (+) Transcript_81901:1863-2504(+)